MSVRRALVDCVVLSLQDSSVFYPSCKGCFSRIDVEQRDTERCRCSRCGYLCLREEVNYRYRLSLRVTRDKHIFGVTVFGSNLNQFFGIDATGLQRLVENTDGSVEPSGRFTLLLKAIEDCFIGRHFIFCMKLTESDCRPWIEGSLRKSSGNKDVPQLIANQMILPKATGLGGCSVVTYYQKLLQKASDSSRASRFPAAQLLLTPHNSPACSFNVTLSSPCFLFQPTQRSQHPDCTLTPTPPWQQSLGVVTSSAEQEESGSSQACGNKNSRKTDSSAIQHWVGRGSLQKPKATEETTPLHLEQSLSCCPSYAKFLNLPSQKSVRTNSTLNTSLTLSQPGHRRHSDEVAESATDELTGTFLSSSVNWEDLPLSESLTAFICGENKDFDAIDTGTNTNALSHKSTERNNVEITNLTTQSTASGQRNAQRKESHSQVLLDVVNLPNGRDRQKPSDEVCRGFIQQENQSQARSISSPRFDEQNEIKLSFENEEQDFIEDAYNCSADLFGSSSQVDTHTESLSWKAETAWTTTEVCPQSLKPNLKHLKQSPRENQRLNRRSRKRDSLTIQDFFPPSQSTPNVKRFVSHSFISPYRKLTQSDRQDKEAFLESMCEPKHKKPVNTTSVLPQLNGLVSSGQLVQCGQVCVKENLTWSTTPTRCSFTPTTAKRLGKPDKYKHFQVQKRSSSPFGQVISHKRDSGVSCVSVCDSDNSDILVPPTPAGQIQQQAGQLGICSRHLVSSTGRQQQVADDDQITVKSSHREEGAAKCVADDGHLDLSSDYSPVDESWTCDWSRDLFSDSV